jgi:hypothetical protein
MPAAGTKPTFCIAASLIIVALLDMALPDINAIFGNILYLAL